MASSNPPVIHEPQCALLPELETIRRSWNDDHTAKTLDELRVKANQCDCVHRRTTLKRVTDKIRFFRLRQGIIDGFG